MGLSGTHPYALLTLGEVLVSVTGLIRLFAGAAADEVNGDGLLVAHGVGGQCTGGVPGRLPRAAAGYFLLGFAGLMAGAAVLFGLRAAFSVPRDYTQG